MKKLVYVTGAGRGIGKAIALKLAKEGYVVAGCSRSLDQLQETRKQSGDLMRIKAVDVTDFKAVQNWIDAEAAETQATPWGLVSAAGIYGPIGTFLENDFSQWKQGIEINLYGTFHACKAFANKVIAAQGTGRIVLLSGGGATQPLPNFTNYCASKAAVVRFGETIAHELKPHHITVNAIAPGAVNTKLTEELIAAGPSKAGRDMYEKALKQKEGGGTTPDKAADLSAWLLSSAASHVTGRLLSAIWDPWPTLDRAAATLDKSDIYTLRRIVPEDRPKIVLNVGP